MMHALDTFAMYVGYCTLAMGLALVVIIVRVGMREPKQPKRRAGAR